MTDDVAAPVVSVVVPTRNRSKSLAALLESLDAQTVGRRKFEILVVDDASTDDTTAVLERARAASRGPFVVICRSESRGPAAARNAGWTRAAASVIAFTDDDCRPAPQWLEAGIACLGEGHGLVMGRTRAAVDSPGYGLHFSRTMETAGEDGRYPTCNVFYLRETLERARGFDESFRYACGEDTDLAWRVKGLGYSSCFCEEALVVHDVRPPSFRTFLRERRRFAEQILLVKRHPHLRSLFYRRYFYRRSHAHALLVLGLGAAAFVISPLALLPVPALWFDRLRSARLVGPWSRRLETATKLLVADLWEFAVFSYASIRYRTILL